MSSLASLFDTYGLRARVQPALLALLPVFITIAVWFPGLYDRAVGLIGVATACGVLAVLANVARARGRKVQPRLYAKWGGEPTTRWLSHAGDHLDPLTKARYHAYLSEHINGWRAPSEERESRDPRSAEVAYESAVRWLRERPGEGPRYSLISKENVSYGFRRNLYGLKPVGLPLAVICVAGNVIAGGLSSLGELVDFPPEAVASLVLSLVAVVVWIGIVRETWVRDAGDSYARALLATCDQTVTDNSEQE